MARAHLGMTLLVLLAGAGCNRDDESTDVDTSTGDGDSDGSTSTSTGEPTTGPVDLTGTTADLTATAADPGEAPFEAICAFHGVKRELCDDTGEVTSEAAELACREVIWRATLADGEVCHDAYADLYYCKTAGACEDLDRPSCFEYADAVAIACPANPML